MTPAYVAVLVDESGEPIMAVRGADRIVGQVARALLVDAERWARWLRPPDPGKAAKALDPPPAGE